MVLSVSEQVLPRSHSVCLEHCLIYVWHLWLSWECPANGEWVQWQGKVESRQGTHYGHAWPVAHTLCQSGDLPHGVLYNQWVLYGSSWQTALFPVCRVPSLMLVHSRSDRSIGMTRKCVEMMESDKNKVKNKGKWLWMCIWTTTSVYIWQQPTCTLFYETTHSTIHSSCHNNQIVHVKIKTNLHI